MDKNLLNSINGNSTLVELLRERADKRSDLRAYTFLADGEAESGHFTFMELDRQARAIAALLQQRTRKGDRVLLLYPPGLEFVAAFFGSLYAGVMAVPAYPPRPNRPMPRLQSIIEDSEATAVLTVDSVFRSMERRFEHTPMLKKMFWVVTDRIEGNPEILWNDPGVNSETIAFLQYTSGSTAAPRELWSATGIYCTMSS
jgi:acyl-CoA synthetase (AMP-forming)/AMP-acid ligase II